MRGGGRLRVFIEDTSVKVTLLNFACRMALVILVAGVSVIVPSCRSIKDKTTDALLSMPATTSNLWASIVQASLAYGRQRADKPTSSQEMLKYLIDFKKDNDKFHAILKGCVKSLDASLPYEQSVMQLATVLGEPSVSSRDEYTQSRIGLLRAICLAETGQIDRAIDSAMEAEAVDPGKDWRIALQLSWLYTVSGQQDTSSAYLQKATSYGCPVVPQSPYRGR
jgi:hypothetical protein